MPPRRSGMHNERVYRLMGIEMGETRPAEPNQLADNFLTRIFARKKNAHVW